MEKRIKIPPSQGKVCLTCKIKKPLDKFNRKKGKDFLYESDCVECQKEKMLDNIDDTINVKKHKKLTDAVKSTITQFPLKENPTKTTRKLKIN